ncbi:hypothetical protein HNR65_000002 [Desulfosalsimonas propionicica]|uniref:Uncharacterized protein n=1 Tax=Desulfosalsimonas propionicica TaxID=332175 RepID=A0A7W0HJ11_9BACT|nr:hypothetical protein [Desulfosalsimonas propionicica]MBA2879695.1 hypothetical protein [Desulfosalsimonas propionicica]
MAAREYEKQDLIYFCPFDLTEIQQTSNNDLSAAKTAIGFAPTCKKRLKKYFMPLNFPRNHSFFRALEKIEKCICSLFF